MKTPSLNDIDLAHVVINNPQAFCDQPNVMATAWQILKNQRGQPVYLDRVGEPQHMVVHQGHIAALAFARRARDAATGGAA